MGKHKYVEYRISPTWNRCDTFINRRYFPNICSALDLINDYGYEIISMCFNDCGMIAGFIVDEGFGKE
ncbi:hypothetical protein CWE04_11210 [Thomasclavelia cocleata]|uniref:Uncharacterized protein n=1 Tax=Thomasclavelia cocleata TaxID=69824 RepID=A0A1I0BDZ2_9FIRM|nr:hypothetical protein [Thomasclavelia cocleata]MCR1959904.1 hypothetical protein [Thomasclavelia cocleata]NDO41750.1 hypothetical protein [Thomasclavelia cocleata]PJN79780.1 hypothetical protein CWE04_11210 [Thomasclavelia cocleata]SET05171.1 hypothetical protein SAMN04489758_10188 [Thomasclavelia cocleata]